MQICSSGRGFLRQGGRGFLEAGSGWGFLDTLQSSKDWSNRLILIILLTTSYDYSLLDSSAIFTVYNNSFDLKTA